MKNKIKEYLEDNLQLTTSFDEIGDALGISDSEVLDVVEQHRRTTFKDWRIKDKQTLKFRYPLTQEALANVFLSPLLEGAKVFRGLIDESDVGGLYTHAYLTDIDGYERRITDFSLASTDQLLSYFSEYNQIMGATHQDGENVFTYKIEIKGIWHEGRAKTPFMSFVDLVKNLKSLHDFYSVEFDYNNYKVFFSQQDLNDWVAKNPDTAVYKKRHTNKVV